MTGHRSLATHDRRRPLATTCALPVALAAACLAGVASTGRAEGDGGRGEPGRNPIPVRTDIESLRVTMTPVGKPSGMAAAGGCPQVVSQHTDASFTGGSYVVQAGFEENEIAAASFTLPPESFPLQVDLMEMIFATSNAIVQTTTHWSILVWEGTPNNGTLVATYSSDGDILPHIVLPPGTNGVNVQVLVDPGDPDQIIVTDNGSHTFSFGYRIDQHNAPGNPCVSAPPSNQNAFPVTDVSGLQAPAGNWIFAVDGQFCFCGSGWFTFQQFPEFCTPSGDWVMRVTWHPFFCDEPQGRCCLTDGSCEIVTEQECAALDGSWGGPDTVCDGTCTGEDVACCFEGGGCVDLPRTTCILAGGFPQGVGTECASTICFPMGACCLPDGSCLDDVSPEDCAAAGGTFRGDGTSCATTDCPDPEGACCFSNGFCLLLTEADCAQAGATWHGFGSVCTDADGNGTADVCEAPCVGDLDGDGVVNVNDVLIVISGWGTPDGDADGDGDTDVDDLIVVVGAWGRCG